MATALLVIYVGLSFLNDDHGFLGTDTGGKVATLRTMSTHHQSKPDVGYWAEAWDPTGRGAPALLHLVDQGPLDPSHHAPCFFMPYLLSTFSGTGAALLLMLGGGGGAAAGGGGAPGRGRAVGGVLVGRSGFAAHDLRPRLLGALDRRRPLALGRRCAL